MDSRVIRAPSLKRGKNDGGLNERIKLKKVLGLTVSSNAALDVSPTTGVLAYPAGCTVVLFNSKKLSQAYLLNTSRKAITAIAYSQCGRYVATGECGQNPAIKVWELDAATPNGCGGTVIAEFLGHKYAVSCIAFSPTGKYLVSVGSQHDMIVNVFDWKVNLKIASNKVSSKVVAVCFSQDGNYFVTVGNRHVKYWYLEGCRKSKEPIPLMGRSAILGEFRSNDFCAVACGKGDSSDSTYAITRSGQLVEFNSRRMLDKWVACRTTSANCLCISSQYILVGCAESIIRVFNAKTLAYMTTLPRTHYLGTDVAQGMQISHITQVPANSKFPDTIAMIFDEPRMKVSCVYNDHSLYIWDLRDIQRVGKSHSFLYHSACIWGVESVPYNFLANPATGPASTLPVDCFLTCSSDDTIRFWTLDEHGNESQVSRDDVFRKNIYSKELLKVLYIDEDLQFIKDVDNPILNMEKPSSYDGRNGVRCIKISPDRQHLATGDRSGNIRIYSLTSHKLITTIEAHDSEVLCLEYTNERIDRKMLASASRDRLIHVFDVENGYRILQTIDDHSSSITSVKFIGAGNSFQMISCGADKAIIFRTFQGNQFLRGNNCAGKTTLYDMEIDSNAKHILTACQDRNIRIYATQTSKHTKTFKGSHSDEGSLIKLSLDLSGIYIATSCTDKTLSVYDYYSTECMARMYGHSELVTGLKFTNDCKHLISASGDGCIFIWQVPHDMIVTMQARLSQQALRSGQMVPKVTQRAEVNNHPELAAGSPIKRDMFGSQTINNELFGSPPAAFLNEELPVAPGYKFSDVGQLPQWAQKKQEVDDVSPPPSAPPTLSSSPSQNPLFGVNPKPRGRWAQKATFEPDALDLRGGGATIPSPSHNQTSDYNSASSKDVYQPIAQTHNHNTYLSEDSSIDSGMEGRRELFLAKNDKDNQLQFESNTEHDGDVEDISDGERTGSDHGLFYPAVAAPGTPTEFKVNAMNEDELRKSVRRQKFERQGLTLSTVPVLSSGGGTGTSDDEDEGSTPSGDNAERSLASTLGGSSESIPGQSASNSFLQAALDGPGSLSDRGERSRRSISAKHNTDSKSSFSKSFSNTKKEELMKVINEAKQQLENVGYRSTLRSSQSISDLSHSANLDRTGLRVQRTSVMGPQSQATNTHSTAPNNTTSISATTNTTNHHHHHHNRNSSASTTTYLNCAASKSVLSQNCQFVRQIQRDLPPYPSELGVYPTGAPKSPVPRPNTLELPPVSPSPSPITLGPKHPSILKHYKSCPVSPVHEELDWSNVAASNGTTSNNITMTGGPTEPSAKRHSMYSDDAKTILDMIHCDTERMIAEITQKYGDLDEYDPIKKSTSNMELKPKIKPKPKIIPPAKQHKEHGFLSDEEHFSSDSLEDCSLDLDHQPEPGRNVCRKHQRKPDQQQPSTLPKRSVSDYFIYDQTFTMNSNRNISLSDILNEDEHKEHQFLSTQRHSSASFFLGPNPEHRKSQESLLSDDNGSGGNGSYFNSMESILSDDSECKSAPLEALFIRSGKRELNQNRFPANPFYDAGASKSYGSSPNTTSGFDFFMQDRFVDSVLPEPADGNMATGYPWITKAANTSTDEFIPRFNPSRNVVVNKSLSKEFADSRHHNNTNPIFDEEPTSGCQAIPKKSFKRMDVFSDPSVYVMRKSCSFDIDMFDGRRTQRSANKKYEQNLEKFEKDRKMGGQNMGAGLAMDYVPHKPPVANRRSSSMKNRRSARDKERYHTVGSSDRPKSGYDERMEEKTFDVYVAEKGAAEDMDSVDSLEFYSKPKDMEKGCSVDSLDGVGYAKEKSVVSSEFLTQAEYLKFRDIEKKIEVINKLVELEERKLEQERLEKERRLKPFSCDSKQKGYVKSLTMNFDKLARQEALRFEEIGEEEGRRNGRKIKRNYSLPDVLEGAKFGTFDVTDEIKEPLSLEFGTDSERMGFREGNPKSLMSSHHHATSDDDPSSSIRRACSLSDLSMGKGFKSTANPAIPSKSSFKPTPPARQSNSSNRVPPKRTNSQVGQKPTASTTTALSGMGLRSISVGTLNQPLSDSDPDPNITVIPQRPTPSSAIKNNGSTQPPANNNNNRPYNTSKTAAGIINRRRGMSSAYSSVNLTTAGQDDSSSEEAQSNPPTSNGKPAIPPRPRSISIDHKRNGLPPGVLSGSPQKAKSSASSSGMQVAFVDPPSKEIDVDNADLTSQLCSNIISQLMVTTNSVMQLHQRLKHNDESSGARQNKLMLKELENAVIMTQSMLTKVTNNRSDSNGSHNMNNGHHNTSSSTSSGGINVSFITSDSNRNIASSNGGDYTQMMDKCSDILHKVQKHVQNT